MKVTNNNSNNNNNMQVSVAPMLVVLSLRVMVQGVIGRPGEGAGLVCCEPVLLAGGLGMLYSCMWFLLVPDTTLTGA